MTNRTLIILAISGVASLWAQPPSLLFSPEDRERIEALAAREPWAAAARNSIVSVAQGWPQSYLSKFGLKELAIPSEGGQWWHHYVCPQHGVRLEYSAPSTNRCPIDGKTFSGWPYDQVVLYERHVMLGETARDLALSYQLTGRKEFAEQAAWILKQYAAKYPSYALHDTNGRVSKSAARMASQTLDESIWLIGMAWAYDLIRDASGVLTDEERSTIENALLRASAATVRGYDAGISNWQSWHNAGMAAVGFTLNDDDLIRHSIEGPNGLRSQLKNSVVDDGFWYEGAWGYHFYALDALTRTAEMATRRGIDIWGSEPNLLALFRTPQRLMFADGSLPMFNDTGSVNLFSQDGLYEYAYGRTGDASLLNVLGTRTRGRNALLFGSESLGILSERAPLESTVFDGAGFAVLRSSTSDHTVMMKFGPHGGGHGHYDKLGITSFAFGGVQAVDPGTQSYAAPTHATWDVMTVAHNTLVVDEKRQAEATGKLRWFQTGDGYSAVSADAGPAYGANVSAARTLVATAEYTLDLTEASASDQSEHNFDWVYHNYGTAQTDLPLSAWNGFGKANGYQHLTGNKGATTGDAWRLTFDGVSGTALAYGSTWASTSSVRGRFELTSEQKFRGLASGKVSYEWSGVGYLLLTTPMIADAPAQKPSGLRLQVYGDGSGHKLTLRINDATEERFVAPSIVVDWTGWKEIVVRAPETWTHYLGNADGVVDTPIRNISIEVGQTAGRSSTGAWYVDDITLEFGDETLVTDDFEGGIRNLRVWMLGADETTVVTGNGLGPDLRKPVPYVLARRRSASGARFAALLEPHRESPTVTAFEEEEPGVFVVRGDGFADYIRIGENGLEYTRER